MKTIGDVDLNALFGVNDLDEFVIDKGNTRFRIDQGVLYYKSLDNVWIEEMDLKVNRLASLGITIVKHIAWTPKENETYWSITSTFDVSGCVNTCDRFDQDRIAYGNAYKTKEDCLLAKRYLIQAFLETKAMIYKSDL